MSWEVPSPQEQPARAGRRFLCRARPCAPGCLPRLSVFGAVLGSRAFEHLLLSSFCRHFPRLSFLYLAELQPRAGSGTALSPGCPRGDGCVGEAAARAGRRSTPRAPDCVLCDCAQASVCPLWRTLCLGRACRLLPAVSTLSDVTQESAFSGTPNSDNEESAVLRAAWPWPAWVSLPQWAARHFTRELGSSCFSDRSVLEAEWQPEPFNTSAETHLKERTVSSPPLRFYW